MSPPESRSIFVVVPTIREDCIKRFIREWEHHFKRSDLCLLVVEDNPECSFDIDDSRHEFPIVHCCWKDIEDALGSDAWIISRRDSSIKCFGFWKAVQTGAKTIIAMDDDCYPLDNYLETEGYDYLGMHLNRLANEEIEVDVPAWESPVKGFRTRGMPYVSTHRTMQVRPANVIVNHGLWYNAPDVDAATQLVSGLPASGYRLNKIISKGSYFPMSGMNVAFKAEAAPLFYFLLMGNDRHGRKWGYSRFDDIWAGIFIKKVADHLNLDVTSGDPVVWHDKASHVFTNLQKEARGIEVNEILWKAVDSVTLTSDTMQGSYRELAEKLPPVNDDEYWGHLRRAMITWAGLF